jgi:autonomous glycyl radical cofactor GrcA
MQNGVSVKNLQYDVQLVTPEMRQQIRELKQELDECDFSLSRHPDLFVSIRAGLDTARQTARCLLTSDPFQAWEKVAIWDKSRAEKRDMPKEVKATANVDKLITRQMRQQIVEAKKTLEDYANSLDRFLREVIKLRSLDVALELAEGLQEARNEREQTKAEEDLD